MPLIAFRDKSKYVSFDIAARTVEYDDSWLPCSCRDLLDSAQAIMNNQRPLGVSRTALCYRTRRCTHPIVVSCAMVLGRLPCNMLSDSTIAPGFKLDRALIVLGMDPDSDVLYSPRYLSSETASAQCNSLDNGHWRAFLQAPT